MKLLALGLLWIVPLFAQSGFDPCSINSAPRPDAPLYLLQPKDHIFICTVLSAQLNRHIFQIQSDGFVTLPSLGRIQAAGLTLQALGQLIAQRLHPGATSERDVKVVEVTCRDC